LMIVPDPAATGRERLKILDFGIAKLASGIGAGDTRPGQVMGSPVYMAPEQCRGAAGVDSKADVYATGAVLYHMLAGQPPFDGETFAALVFMHLHEPLIPLTERGVDAPPALIDCVHSLLQKDPKLRPTMRETAERLNDQLVHRALAMEGTCTGEHGIGLHKQGFLVDEAGSGAVEMMRTLKRALDPKNILNPGKIFTL